MQYFLAVSSNAVSELKQYFLIVNNCLCNSLIEMILKNMDNKEDEFG